VRNSWGEAAWEELPGKGVEGERIAAKEGDIKYCFWVREI
jgi:hypothetical protein